MRGFTLIELLLGISLLMILSALTFFSGRAIFARTEYQVIKDEIQAAVRYASNQSLISGRTVYLSSLADDDWSSGMRLYALDQKKKTLLYQWHWRHPNWSIRWDGFQARNEIPFSPHPVSAAANGRFLMIDLKTKEKKSIILNRLARISDEDHLYS